MKASTHSPVSIAFETLHSCLVAALTKHGIDWPEASKIAEAVVFDLLHQQRNQQCRLLLPTSNPEEKPHVARSSNR